MEEKRFAGTVTHRSSRRALMTRDNDWEVRPVAP